jgi:hypothetical protein
MAEPTFKKNIIYRKEDWEPGSTSYSTQLRELQTNAHENPLLSNKDNKRVFITSKYQRAYTKYNVNALYVYYLTQSASNRATPELAWSNTLSTTGSLSKVTTVNTTRLLGAYLIASGSNWNAGRSRMFIRFSKLATDFSSLSEYLGLMVNGGSTAPHYFLTEENLFVYQISNLPETISEAKSITPIATIGSLSSISSTGNNDATWEMVNKNIVSGTFYLMIDRENWDSQPSAATIVGSSVYYPALLRIDQGNVGQSTSGYWPKYCFDYDSENWELGVE